MHLEIDMGNTRIKWRLRDGGEVLERGALDTGADFAELGVALGLHMRCVSTIWVVSVVGDEIEQKLISWAESFFSVKPIFARSCEKVGVVKNGYDLPERLGVDRWLGLLAGYRLVGGACVVVSCGTAMTVDLVSRDGKHKGGYIVPGFGLLLNSINSAARLILIDKEMFSAGLLPGKSTEEAVFSGVSAMLGGVIENGVRQLLDEEYEKVELILTGGDANKLLPLYPHAHVVPDLILDGLVCAME